jgi:hypothetical protein
MKSKLIIVLFLALILVLTGCGVTKLTKVLSAEEAKAKAVDFINKNLVQPGTTVTIDNVTEENGLYKLSVKLSSGQTVDSYITKDGTKFFTQALDIAQIEKENQNTNQNANQTQPTEIPKNDKPVVELFVMSHCPYGTQIEKGILPVVQALGNKIDFEVKFCDYAMHGQKELTEELRQVCIKQVASDSYLNYLNCFLKAGDGEGCVKETKIDSAKLNSCVSNIDNKYNITKYSTDHSKWVSGQYPPFDVYKADNEKYGVQGSPTLIINGVESQSGRDSASLLKTVCSAFTNAPSECSAKLSSDTPAPGFGSGTTSSGASASCGS